MKLSRMCVTGLVLLAMAGCGGGGDDSQTGTPIAAQGREALPTLSQDINPSGARLDYRSRNYFPAAAGDTWTYDRREGSASSGTTLTRSATSAGNTDVLITETALGESSSATYRRTAEGVLEVMPMADWPAAANQIVGDLLEYPEPFYATNQLRTLIRQGNLGEDLDEDGVSESFRLELRQTFFGFEAVTLPNGYQFQDVARFRNIWSVTIQPSDRRYQPYTQTSTEEAWWAPGVGLVRANRSLVDSTGVDLIPAYTLHLTGGMVAGVSVFAGTRLPLVHNALVYDRVHNVYYASIPGSVPINGNRIAIVDPASGAITYSSATVGSQPSAMALNADATALYVALNGTGDVVKLSLPGFAEQWRVRLPAPSFYGQLATERIAVSPTDADLVAVSTMRAGVSPRHGGVALIRNGVLQPRMTQDHTGSNLITFGADGTALFGFNNETTEFGLRRITVVADGLQQAEVVSASGNFGSRTLDWSPQGIVLDRTVYRSSDLAQVGQAEVEGGGCRPHNVPGRLVCALTSRFTGSAASELAVVDATTFVILTTPNYGHMLMGGTLADIVPGPVGQVALRLNATYYNSSSDVVVLFNSTEL